MAIFQILTGRDTRIAAINEGTMKTTTQARAVLSVISVMIVAAAISGQDTQKAVLHDPVAELAGRITRGETHLTYASNGWGYLPSLLQHLDLSIDSQILVFSKTSFQLTKISRPDAARALLQRPCGSGRGSGRQCVPEHQDLRVDAQIQMLQQARQIPPAVRRIGKMKISPRGMSQPFQQPN